MTQTEQVLSYIQTHGSIDPLRAFTELGILRLGARIFDLRAEGHDIVTINRTKRTDSGIKTWAEYTLKKPLPSWRTEERRESGKVTNDSASDIITQV